MTPEPPLVGVPPRIFAEDPNSASAGFGFFSSADTRLVRPNLQQIGEILIELDVPEHDGSVHFLEVALPSRSAPPPPLSFLCPLTSPLASPLS